MKPYVPHPFDTSHIPLPDGIEELREKLAEQIHEVWAKQRVSQGWTPGPKRDDTAKTHPCLVPYADLPEVEKDYDRATAMQTLKFIVASGYRIAKD